jgi:DUF971 family protein
VPDIAVPSAIHRGDHEIVVTWSPEQRTVYPARFLRLQCQCAQCRDEFTGRRLLDQAAVPPDVSPVRLSLVGHYAIRIEWSDGHGTGIYTYEFLHRLSSYPMDRSDGADMADDT